MSNKQHMEITVCKAENVRETEGKIPAVRMEEDPFRNMTGKDVSSASYDWQQISGQ